MTHLRNLTSELYRQRFNSKTCRYALHLKRWRMFQKKCLVVLNGWFKNHPNESMNWFNVFSKPLLLHFKKYSGHSYPHNASEQRLWNLKILKRVPLNLNNPFLLSCLFMLPFFLPFVHILHFSPFPGLIFIQYLPSCLGLSSFHSSSFTLSLLSFLLFFVLSFSISFFHLPVLLLDPSFLLPNHHSFLHILSIFHLTILPSYFLTDLPSVLFLSFFSFSLSFLPPFPHFVLWFILFPYIFFPLPVLYSLNFVI